MGELEKLIRQLADSEELHHLSITYIAGMWRGSGRVGSLDAPTRSTSHSDPVKALILALQKPEQIKRRPKKRDNDDLV